MAKPLLILLFASFCCWHAYASGDPFPLGGRAWGLAGASVTFTDGWAIWNNTAGMAHVKDRQVMAAYDLRYGMKGLQTMAIGYVHPLPIGVAGIGISRMGDELYNETTVSLGYGYAWEKISMGGRLNYVQIGMAEAGTRQSVSLDIGMRAQLLPDLTLGVSVCNASQSAFDRLTKERMPTVMKAGLAYQASAKIMVLAEAGKDVNFPAVFTAGLEYEIVKNLRLRTGIASRPQTYAFGIGCSPKKLQLDYALRTHSVLGLSHHLSLQVTLSRKKVNRSSTAVSVQ